VLLGASLALAGAFGGAGLIHHQQKKQAEFESFFSALREKVYAGYQYHASPSEKNKRDYLTKVLRYSDIYKKQKIKGIESHLLNNKVFCLHHRSDVLGKPKDSWYAGKIVEKRKVKGIDVYLTETESEDFTGIKTLEYFVDKNEFVKRIKYANGRNIIVIDLSPIKANGKKVQDEWKEYKLNNRYFKSNDPRWSPEKQAVYNVLKGIPYSKIAEEYVKKSVGGSIIHEHFHANDLKKDGLIEREVRAYLFQLTHSPLVLDRLEALVAIKNPKKIDALYQSSAKRIFEGLMNFPDMKTKCDLYRLSKEEISKRAKKLFDNWYN